jgi:diguanylate cyclase (GGDEF)-like protein
MQRIAFSKLIGLLLIASGGIVMLGWCLHVNSLVNFLPESINPMVFNAALLFFLSGIALIYRKIRFFLGVFIALFSAATLSQNYFNFQLGIDNIFATAWLPDQPVSSGRMAENNALAFIFAGLAMILFSYKKNRLGAILLQVSIFTVLILGISALLGYLFNFENLYLWYQKTSMSFQAAIGITLLGLALWSIWSKGKEFREFYHNELDKKIVILSLTIMISVILFTVFALLLQPLSLVETKKNLLPFILLSLVIGMSLFFLQLVPLVKKISRSRKSLLIANHRLQTSKEQLSKAAYRDTLTGLINRRKLEESVNDILLVSQRKKTQFALFFLDLDHFKNTNDTAGHEAGDELLKVVAKRLKNILRENDVIARIGGDEFVIVITDVTGSTIAIIANKILNTILAPIIIKGLEHYITFSIGISVYPDDGTDFATLIKNADLALYRAKEQGRNNYQFCTHEMTTVAQEKIAKQSAINQAFVKNEFYLEYQPYLNLQTGRISGIDVFVRWQHEKYGLVTSDEIYAIAVETGLIKLLNQWILNVACQQVKEWQELGFAPLMLSVKFPLSQFKYVSLKEDILLTLQEANFAARDLELSIQEENFNQEAMITMKNIQNLKKLGMQVSIDNFGKGSSSLDYLKKVGIDKIKIDNSFISKLPHDSHALEIVSAIIAMANKLAVKSFASCVDTKEQFDLLVKEKCTELQGFYFCPPKTAEATLKFLKEFTDKSISEETAGAAPDA